MRMWKSSLSSVLIGKIYAPERAEHRESLPFVAQPVGCFRGFGTEDRLYGDHATI
jgi:hypothetical protein